MKRKAVKKCIQDMTWFDYSRLVMWMKDPARKPAIHAFTAGTLRQCARAFEEYLESCLNEKIEHPES